MSIVYCIGPDRRGAPVKVGWCAYADAIPRRLGELQTGNPERLAILNAYACENAAIERLTHLALDAARLSGEWFDPYRDVRVEHLACAPSRPTADLVWRTLLPRRCELPRRLGATSWRGLGPVRRSMTGHALKSMYVGWSEPDRLLRIERQWKVAA